MAFCKFSGESIEKSSTLVDNNFISQYLPCAPDSCVKVYLLGLLRCAGDGYDNTLENFAKTLKLSEQDVEDAFLFWQEQGLVTVINVSPIEVRYLPVKDANRSIKQFSKSKYSGFNKQIQAIIEGRMITPTEYAEYYTLIESLHVEPAALIMIIKYCTTIKGSNVGYNYILTVAKNWAYEGVKTASDVEEKLKLHEQIIGEVSEVIKLLGSKKQPDFDDRQLFIKWTKELGFDRDVIYKVAKTFKKKGNFEKLDKKLTKYFELKLLSDREIDDFEANKEQLYSTAKEITKSIGIYYENLENVIDIYVVKWQNMGYSREVLKQIADFCFKNNIKTLDAMDSTVERFYSLGLLTSESIKEYFNDILSTDKEIKRLLELVGLSRNVTSWDRDFYRTWTYVWNFTSDIIEYASSFAVGKSHALNYVNKILSEWFKRGITTLEEAKKQNVSSIANQSQKSESNFKQRSYSAEEINALFDNLNEVKWK